jgi:hypothetical protein
LHSHIILHYSLEDPYTQFAASISATTLKMNNQDFQTQDIACNEKGGDQNKQKHLEVNKN